jgi:hypothetical protein
MLDSRLSTMTKLWPSIQCMIECRSRRIANLHDVPGGTSPASRGPHVSTPAQLTRT